MKIFVRVTPYETTTLDQVCQVIEQLEIVTYFISYEEASRPHFHLYLETEKSVERLRYQLKSKLSGQVYISQKEVQDKVKAIAYTMKDGNYRQKGIDINTYLMAQQITYKKPTFDKDLKELIEGNTDNTEKLIDDIIELYVKYNRKIYIQHIQSLVRTIQAKKKPEYRKYLRRRIMETL